jgi:hypothetical protein
MGQVRQLRTANVLGDCAGGAAPPESGDKIVTPDVGRSEIDAVSDHKIPPDSSARIALTWTRDRRRA